MTSPFEELQSVISDYFDALYYCDTDLLEKVFHAKAVYATADETPLLHRTMAEYVPVVAARQSPASRGEARRDVIDEIQFAGKNTAFARVRCSIGPNDFTDFLTFVREDGDWKIMAKVFQIKPRKEGN
ncbi:nuclear transport factor 2 family protein [Roseibium sediminicola]|uniref:Nuclear transport factor 2 family protein n=1 Tax=Roseibium sediminicola TaxID=2933272 RepID=A0ABT0GMV9_9HYPH|nr:nuclear transport factor 2 family protein [Roseibium sp. CAU 1639]MCK7610760.1 nuclear transport factor 2 family protein [Roseibium sp. CAU 1639]